MRVEGIAIALRARTPWEAIDLGFVLARHWARPLWTVWCVLFVPVSAVALVALQARPWLAVLLLWWLLPLFDRFLLHVLAHAVFGARPTLASTLGSWRSILSGGLPAALLLRPLAWRRTFLTPVLQLEGQRGAAARRRGALLAGRVGGPLLALSLVCVGFELVVVVGTGWLLELLQPAGWLAGTNEEAAAARGPAGFNLRAALLAIVAFSVVEPLFVAAGFALYLSRRVQLEGWDIELGLRRIAAADAARPAARPAAASGPVAAVLAVVLLAALPLTDAAAAGGCPLPDPDQPVADGFAVEPAGDARRDGLDKADGKRAGKRVPAVWRPVEGPAREAIGAILADPAFGETVQVEGWHLRRRDDRDSRIDFDWLRSAGDLLGSAVRAMAWIVLVGLLLALVWAVARRWQREPAAAPDAPPAVLFGMAITPDSLPDDIAGSAARALAAGELREALSLLYRGALSDLVHRRGVRIGHGATEGDVLRIARARLPTATAGWFERLLPEWIALAYGHRPPAVNGVQQLCAQYATHFAAAPAAGASE